MVHKKIYELQTFLFHNKTREMQIFLQNRIFASKI